jgi:hypothetical protein
VRDDNRKLHVDVCPPIPTALTSFVAVILLVGCEEVTKKGDNRYQNTRRDVPKDKSAKSEIQITIYNILISTKTLRTFLFVEIKFLKVLYPDVERCFGEA